MPGVLTIEVPTLPPSVALVPSAVPVFIGYTQTALKDGEVVLNKPVRIKSMRDYEDWFGGAAPQVITATANDRSGVGGGVDVKITSVGEVKYRLYYALQLYFINGGGPCYIISIGDYAKAVSEVDFVGNDGLSGGLAVARKAKEITILVFPDAVALPADKYGVVIKAALAHCQKYINRVTIIDVKDAEAVAGKPDNLIDDNEKVTANFRDKMPSDINQKKYGAAYFPFLKTTMSYAYDDSAIVVGLNTYQKKAAAAGDGGAGGAAAAAGGAAAGAGAGAAAGGAGAAAAGGGAGAAAAAGAAKPDPNDPTLEFVESTPKLDKLETDNNLIYSKIKEAIRQNPVIMPPSAAVAGVYVATDFSQGVWKAPANVSLAGVVGTTIEIDDDFHADLNVHAATGKSVNAIRPYTGKGILIFGARTLAGNDLEWRYISVRRTFCFIEDAVGQAMQDFVFVPNTRDTWIKVKAMISNFLIQIWKAGGLFGNTPDEAFQVVVGQPETMNDIDILEGRMIVDIKLRVARPAEFIILRYEHKFQTNSN
ncbi:hypothetical protein GCM10027190_29450 [Spirosoma areae]